MYTEPSVFGLNWVVEIGEIFSCVEYLTFGSSMFSSSTLLSIRNGHQACVSYYFSSPLLSSDIVLEAAALPRGSLLPLSICLGLASALLFLPLPWLGLIIFALALALPPNSCLGLNVHTSPQPCLWTWQVIVVQFSCCAGTEYQLHWVMWTKPEVDPFTKWPGRCLRSSCLDLGLASASACLASISRSLPLPLPRSRLCFS